MRKIIILPIIAIAAVAVILVLFGSGAFSFFEAQKIEVSNLKLDYGSGLFDSREAKLSFAVANRYNSHLLAIGPAIDEVNYGFFNWGIPAGQTSEVILGLPDMNLTSSTTYNVKLTFSFQDGKYYDLSASVTTPSTLTQIDEPTTQEKVTIQGVGVTAGEIYVQCVAGGPIKITDYIVKDSAGLTQSAGQIAANTLDMNGVLTAITLPSGWSAGLSGTYTITLVSEAGNYFVSPAFVVS
jgi:hypothetical protein